MMPAAPADANRLTPYCRTESKVISATAAVTITSTVFATRCRMRICVTCLRASRLSSTIGAEAAKVDLDAKVERYRRGPAERQHKRHQQRVPDHPAVTKAREIGASQSDTRDEDDDDHAGRALTARQQPLQKRAVPPRQSDQPSGEPAVNQERDGRRHDHRDDADDPSRDPGRDRIDESHSHLQSC